MKKLKVQLYSYNSASINGNKSHRKLMYKLFIIMSVMLITLCSCVKKEVSQENSAVNQTNREYFSDDSTIAIILNNLDEKTIEEYKLKFHIEEYGDFTYENALLIPRYNNSKIQVYSAKIENNQVIKDELLFENNINDDYGILLKMARPESIPYIITMQFKNSEEANVEFYYSYDGKNGTPKVEYIKKETKL